MLSEEACLHVVKYVVFVCFVKRREEIFIWFPMMVFCDDLRRPCLH